MAIRLPDEFLNYNYFWRQKWAKELVDGKVPDNMFKMLIDTTRILPALCSAELNPDGTISTNAKIIGAGFVPKKERLAEVSKIFRDHIAREGMAADKTEAFGRHELASKEDKEKMREFQKKSLKILIDNMYFDKEIADQKIDFTKICTIELGNQYPGKPAHMWNFAQKNNKATLLYFTPPVVSYEFRCSVEIHTEGPYFEFTHAVHDVYFGEDPSEVHLPVYIFNIEEAYDNSATPRGYGRKMV